jgi:hypothetical protein
MTQGAFYDASGDTERLSRAVKALKRYAPPSTANLPRSALDSLQEQMTMLVGASRGLAAAAPPRTLLENLLEVFVSQYELSGGVIYVVDDAAAKLSCEAFFSAEGKKVQDTREFGLSLELDRDLAVEAFRTGVIQVDRASPPTHATPAMLQAFNIEGSLIAVPLRSEGRIVGVMTLWSNEPTQAWAPDILSRLGADPMSSFAATVIDIFQAEAMRRRGSASIALIASNLTRAKVSPEDIGTILQAFKALGFDRTRLFQLSGQSFVLRGALGAPEVPMGLEISLENPYVKHTLARTRHGDASPIRFEPGQFGPDPDATRVGRPSDVPWLVVPLMNGGVLHGQLVADNAASKRPLRLDHLVTVFSTLAAQTIANLSRQDAGDEDAALASNAEELRPLVRAAVEGGLAPVLDSLRTFEATMKRAVDAAARLRRHGRA